MNITLISIGKPKKGPESDLAQEYIKRLDGKVVHKWLSDREAQDLGSKLGKNETLVVLDERGQSFASPDLAKAFEKLITARGPNVTCIIGGAEGHTQSMRDRADLLWALGPATWPHQIVPMLVCEQLYRTQQILKGHPYHK
ncbi:MAG: 23S rRNA (pseudouridine(1915)-N(3))-methyltransferase RlmH [Alphaproteobacteria bacterium]